MGRRKIEIKAIKDDRNRSVTFLKRKGGLFKKAHELSVLCSVDVAVFIFGNNKKLYEYSSTDMRDLISRYQYHGGPNEHKGPSDFNGGNDDDDDDENDGTPPLGNDGPEHHMMPPQFHQPPFPHMRHHTPSASPPVPNGSPFQAHQGHPGHPAPRGTTPQPSMGSRPGSRNDVRRMGPGMAPQPHGAHTGITYMPTPPIYSGSANQPAMLNQPPSQYQYPPQAHPQQHQQQPQQQPQPQPQPQPQQQPYMEERRPSAPPSFTPHPPPHGPPASRREPSPAYAPSHPLSNQQQLPAHQPPPHISPPPQPERRPQDPQPPPPMSKPEPFDRQPPLLNTDSAIKKLPQRKSHSIFTPIEENRSILSQHLASFSSEPQGVKLEPGAPASSRSQSVDVAQSRGGHSMSPQLNRSTTQGSVDKARASSVSSGGPDSAYTPSSTTNSLKINGPGGASRPQLRVQIPDGGSEPGSAGGESNSPHNATSTPTQQAPRQNSVVLPPPSPSASALLSAGATGPRNPFARPPPQQNVNGETPVSALPSRFLNTELLPSPSSFYPDWNFRGTDSNTLPSPLNFATPVVGTGPSFLRDDNHGGGAAGSGNSHSSNGTTTAAASASTTASSSAVSATAGPGLTKRKSPDYAEGSQGSNHEGPNEPKRPRVKYT